jgi:hypothetical protein
MLVDVMLILVVAANLGLIFKDWALSSVFFLMDKRAKYRSQK